MNGYSSRQVIKMFTELRRRMNEYNENFHRDRKYKKIRKRSQSCNITTELKNTPGGFNKRLN